MKRILPIIVVAVVFGCSPKQSPESKVELAHFVSQDVRVYLNTMLPETQDANAMVEAFPPILSRWRNIESRHNLPEKKVIKINSAINLHRLILICFEKPPHEMGVSEEEENKLYESRVARQEEIARGIDAAHWNHIRKRMKDPGIHKPDGEKVLSGFEKYHSASLGYPDGFASVIIANFGYLVDQLASLTK